MHVGRGHQEPFLPHLLERVIRGKGTKNPRNKVSVGKHCPLGQTRCARSSKACTQHPTSLVVLASSGLSLPESSTALNVTVIISARLPASRPDPLLPYHPRLKLAPLCPPLSHFRFQPLRSFLCLFWTVFIPSRSHLGYFLGYRRPEPLRCFLRFPHGDSDMAMIFSRDGHLSASLPSVSLSAGAHTMILSSVWLTMCVRASSPRVS